MASCLSMKVRAISAALFPAFWSTHAPFPASFLRLTACCGVESSPVLRTSVPASGAEATSSLPAFSPLGTYRLRLSLRNTRCQNQLICLTKRSKRAAAYNIRVCGCESRFALPCAYGWRSGILYDRIVVYVQGQTGKYLGTARSIFIWSDLGRRDSLRMETAGSPIGSVPLRTGTKTSEGRIHALLLWPVKLLVLPFRMAWLLIVWLRLRRKALKTAR